ncbi:MAG: PAS domain S-box protein [Bacteroidales bacterium]|nr:PAS domain S-box protein [Bacteroidales bacterium]
MRRIPAKYLLLFFCIMYAGVIQASDLLRVGIYDNPPKVFMDNNHRPAGLFVDIIDHISEKEGFEIEYIYDSWGNHLDNLSNGYIDVLVDVAYSEERAAKYVFNQVPVIESWVQFFVSSGNIINEINDLNYKSIAVLKESLQDRYLRTELREKFDVDFLIRQFDDYEQAIDAIKQNRVDLLLADRFFYFSGIRDTILQPTPLIFNPVSLFFAFNQSVDKRIINSIDVSLGKLKNESGSVYYQSLNKWLELPEPASGNFYLILIVVLAGVLILIAAWLIVKLYRRLIQKNRELKFRTSILESANKMLEELLEERRRTEEAVKQSEEAFRSLFLKSADAFSLLKDGVFVDCNDAALNFFGFKKREELLGKSIWDLSPELQPDGTKSFVKAKEIISKCIEQGNQRFEWIHKRLNGKEVYAEIVLTQISFKGDELIHAGLRNISKRKEMEKNLRESEERYRLLVENINDLVVKVNTESKFLFVSPSYCRLFGKTQKELLNKTFLPLVHPDDRKSTEREMKKLYSPPYSCYLEQRALTVEGWRWIAWNDTAVLDDQGNVIEIIGVGRDITKQKEAEFELRENEKRWMLALAGTGDGVWDWNLVTNQTYYSKGWKDMLGYDMNDLENNYDTWEKLVHTDDLPDVINAINKHLKGETQALVAEYRMLAKNDKYKWILDRGKIIEKDKKGKPLRMIGTHSDITPYKESQLYLEDRVALRTAQMEAVNKELEAFSYTVSHDLRAPLRAITGFTKILSSQYEKQFDDEARRLFGIISDNAEIMDRLITDLLEFSRIGRNSIKRVEVDMFEMVNEVINELTNEQQKAKIKFIIDELPNALADKNLIKQVWVNIISNAVKFTALQEKPEVTIGWKTNHDKQIYFVKDNGVGFKSEYKHKIFQVFQRLHNTNEFEGSGVGLAIAQRIILRHEGNIWATGEEGEGATFSFSLPAMIAE